MINLQFKTSSSKSEDVNNISSNLINIVHFFKKKLELEQNLIQNEIKMKIEIGSEMVLELLTNQWD